MGRRHAILACLLGVAAVAYAGVAVAHGNHASAGPQVSANGSVVVEQAFLSQQGYVAITTDPDSGEGRVLGARPLGVGLHTGIRVGVDSDYWATTSGNTTLRVRLYADDGDGQFDPDSDPVLRWLDRPAGDAFAVRKATGSAYVVPSGDTSLSADGRLPVARLALPARGHVVVHDATNDTLGPPLGHRSLDAGHYRDVRVPIDSDVGNRSVAVAIHRDDGDGQFESDSDPVVRVGDTPVAARLSLSVDGRQPVQVNTPTRTRSAPATTTADTTTAATPTASDTTAASGPGVGFLGTLCAVLALAVGASWRRR